MHPAKATAIVLVVIAFLGFVALKLNADWEERKAATLNEEGADRRNREIENRSGITWAEYKSVYSARYTILYMADGQTIIICGWVALPAGGCVDTLHYRRVLKTGSTIVYQRLGCIAFAPDNWVKDWETTGCSFDGTE